MKRIVLLALSAKEAADLVSGCRYLPIPKGIRIELHGLAEHLIGLESAKLTLFPANTIEELIQGDYSSAELLYFCSFAARKKWNQALQQHSSAIFVHQEMAILEVSESLQAVQAMSDAGLTACYLSGDASYCADNGILYNEISDYLQKPNPKHVLVTANHHLAMAMLALEPDSWEVFHPEDNARNLVLELSSSTNSSVNYALNHAFMQLSHRISNPSSVYDLMGIRNAREADKHAYSFFARHYDEYMAHVDYEMWISRILSWQKQYSSLKLKKILELACGTANVSNRLIYKGYEVDASDLSPEMLFMADQKELKPRLYQASLTDPIPDKDYDLVLCMFDSVNYLSQAGEFSQMLENVHGSLADKGLYIFDVSTLLNSEENFDDICSMMRVEGGYLVHQAWFEALHASQKSSLNYFRKEAIGFSHHYEQHQQHVYMCHELIQLITDSPLTLVAIHSTETSLNFYPRHLNAIDAKYYRLFFVLQRS